MRVGGRCVQPEHTEPTRGRHGAYEGGRRAHPHAAKCDGVLHVGERGEAGLQHVRRLQSGM